MSCNIDSHLAETPGPDNAYRFNHCYSSWTLISALIHWRWRTGSGISAHFECCISLTHLHHPLATPAQTPSKFTVLLCRRSTDACPRFHGKRSIKPARPAARNNKILDEGVKVGGLEELAWPLLEEALVEKELAAFTIHPTASNNVLVIGNY